MRHLIAITFIILYSVGHSAGKPFEQKVFVCKQFDTIQSLFVVQQQNDHIAMNKLEDAGINSGDCMLLSGDALVFVAAVSDNQIVAVRQRGDPSELWTLASFLPRGFVPGR